ncbi:hypothetical protein [Methylobacterium sp. 285MFTsu5.1]|uniref:hypothetical protein n=1 Tax=Methylobacterium sp. 285MFTsu5.1 TaxID=1172187 RepID=UPI001319FD62|nr:hypothetical protein [Methylobacterium sp. 285MFTsu5.1]
METPEQLSIYYGNGKEQFGALLDEVGRAATSNHETDLCRIMKRCGSDKGLGWHNYTLLYQELFRPFINERFHLLEVGIGTNNLDVPSNMGESGVPGASLRGWREFFLHCTVCGADVDKRILFEEDRIRTFFVDQNDTSSIDNLFSTIPHIEFDIIIDDGLHEVIANRNLFERAIHRLKSGGVYVIEDIVTTFVNLSKFDELIAQSGMSGFIYQLPSEANKIDNAVAVIKKA